MRFHHSSRGFTLVELSVVLVIIGLIVSGILAARSIIQNARVNNAVSGIQSIQSAAQNYTQTYGAVAGDDIMASSRFGTKLGATTWVGNNDGAIAGAFNDNDTSKPSESQLFWAHLRAAGLVKGSGTQVTLPANPFNGFYGVQNGGLGGSFADGTTILCLDKVAGSAAQAIDARLDDGLPDQGAVRASATITTTPESAYKSADTYALCTEL